MVPVFDFDLKSYFGKNIISCIKAKTSSCALILLSNSKISSAKIKGICSSCKMFSNTSYEFDKKICWGGKRQSKTFGIQVCETCFAYISKT